MDKGKRRFNQDRKPIRSAKQGKPEFKREREDDAFTENGSTDKLEGRNAVTEALQAGRDFNKIWLLKPEGDKPLDHGLIRILDEANKRGIIVTRATPRTSSRCSTVKVTTRPAPRPLPDNNSDTIVETLS